MKALPSIRNPSISGIYGIFSRKIPRNVLKMSENEGFMAKNALILLFFAKFRAFFDDM